MILDRVFCLVEFMILLKYFTKIYTFDKHVGADAIHAQRWSHKLL